MIYNKDKTDQQQPKNTGQPTAFPLKPVSGKSVELRFNGQDISSDGGALLLREVDRQIGLTEALAGCISDTRDSRYVTHQMQELLSQRIYGIGCGYEDGNDWQQLKSDPIFKMCSGRAPYSGADLASQPTISRLENGVHHADLYRLGECLVDTFIRSYDSEPSVVIMDCDDTNNNTHGGQQLTMFNSYYGEYCYMPVHIYEGLSGKLITSVLKPGRRSKGADVLALLRRIIQRLRQVWPATVIVVRGDAHFGSHELMEWIGEQHKVHFITGLAGNSRLKKQAKCTIESAQTAYKRGGRPVKRYHSFCYKAGSWAMMQRVIVKVEVTHQGTNVRYIVTDMVEYRTRELYEKGYCMRGAMELRIKDHKRYLRSDRSSCSRFQANQLRLMLHSAAYVLIHTLQKQLFRGHQLASATFKTIQRKVLKVAGWVRELATKITIELPQCYPYVGLWSKSLTMLGQLRC